MVNLTEEMKAQLMKMTGISDVSEFDSLVKQHAPDVGDFDQSLQKHSPFDLQMIMFKEHIENRGIGQYEALATLEDKIKFVYETLIKDDEFKNVLKLPLKPKSKKDAEKSKKLRDLGNKNFQSKVNEEAIRYYNESIMAAPFTEGQSREAALGLANRSVVLYNLAEYETCLSDISAALMFGYPENLQYKMFERQGKCFQALGNHIEAKKSFEKSLELLKVSKVAEDKKPAIAADLSRSVAEVAGECGAGPVAVVAGAGYRVTRAHAQFPAMTEAVRIVYEEEVGRHGLATRDIAPGDIIMIEDPLCWTVNVAKVDSVCQWSMTQVGRTPIPSPWHEGAVFSCYDSLVKFQQTFPFNDLPFVELFSSGMAESGASVMLAYRCLVQKPASFFIENKAKLFSDYNPRYCVDEAAGWSLAGEENVYRAIYNLVHHMDKLTIDKELNIMVKTAVLLRFLIVHGYFADAVADQRTISEDQAFIGKLLFTFQCGINHNQHGVYAADGRIEAGKRLPLVDVGASIYPHLLLLNHSCAPNTLRINRGHRTYLIAKHAIKEGEEVFDCYGPHHLSNAKADRQKLITNAFVFECKCPACRDNWPMWNQVESRLSPGEMSKLGTSLSKYQTNFREHKLDSATANCVEYLRRLDEMRIGIPHRNYEIASMALSSCYWAELQ